MATAIAITLFDAIAVYAIARRTVEGEVLRISAVALLLGAPAHVYFSVTNPTALVPASIALAWLWCVTLFQSRRDTLPLIAAAVLLGLGCYTYSTSVVLMPLYLLITIALLQWQRQLTPGRLLALCVAFVVPASAGIWHIATHREIYVDVMQRYKVYDADRLNVLQGVKDYLNYNNVQERVSLYWTYFDPSYLFLIPMKDMPSLAGGVLPLVGIVLVPLGLRVLILRRSFTDLAILVGFLTAPMAAILVDEPYVVRRELVVIPFATLAMLASATTGSARFVSRGAFVLLACLAGLQGVLVAVKVAGAWP